MANKNKITVREFEKAVKAADEKYAPTVTVDWNGLQVIIKKHLSILEMSAFVDNVIQFCFTDDGDFAPEFKDFAVRVATIKLYTNISLPSDIERQYDLLYGTDIWDIVFDTIADDQFRQMVIAIESKLAAMRDTNTTMLNKQINEFYSTVETMQQQFSRLFDGLEADDIKNLIGAVVNGGIDEEKLMKAYLANQEA